jgi:hypothetical protein
VNITGLNESWLWKTTHSVYPSPFDWAHACAAGMPAAPPRFSMTMGCPSRGLSSLAAARMMTSVKLPAAIETIMRIGFVG